MSPKNVSKDAEAADKQNPTGDGKIADNASEFVSAVEDHLKTPHEKWLPRVDQFLVKNSWDITQGKMLELIKSAIKNKETLAA